MISDIWLIPLQYSHSGFSWSLPIWTISANSNISTVLWSTSVNLLFFLRVVVISAAMSFHSDLVSAMSLRACRRAASNYSLCVLSSIRLALILMSRFWRLRYSLECVLGLIRLVVSWFLTPFSSPRMFGNPPNENVFLNYDLRSVSLLFFPLPAF